MVTVPGLVTEMASQRAAGLGGPQNVTLGLQQRCSLCSKVKEKNLPVLFEKNQPFKRLSGSTRGLSLPGEFTDLG